MKTIIYEDVEYQYEVTYCDESYDFTTFYLGTKPKTRKKYCLWGETITTFEPKYAFSLSFDIECPKYTKDEVRLEVSKKVAILNRQNEIKRGEII